MKIILRLILLYTIVLSNPLFAISFKNYAFGVNNTKESVLLKSSRSAIYKHKSLSAFVIVTPPTTVAGSSCGPGIINLSATGASGDIIEWFSSQTSSTVLATGNTYSPNLSVTTTFYVSARSALGTSTRVPVVASVYNTPPPVTLSANPANNTSNPLCLGTSVTFTATGGADLFEFSVDGVVKQAMSSNRTYTTNTLTNGQVVSVKSRYAVTLDGSLSESAWGTGPLEDNVLSAALSGNAADGYINALKISPTEDKLVFGIAGKALNYRRIMIFLDTKPGGFNVSNYGDENGSLPDVRAFNYFNNNPSTFDSYFYADYCIAIATDAGQTSYYADVIELKTGNSTKTYLGTAATGLPTAVMGVNKNNTGISDYNLGFEVEVSKALVGYTGGDVKFFAFTMQDNASNNYNVTNSFLSPATRTSDYGSGAVDYNSEDPNPVVVAEAALTPCYSSDSMTMNFAANPSVATVGVDQSKCSLVSAALGGNTPSVGNGVWSKKSGPGTVAFSDSSLGNATATVSVPGTYVFTWTISSGQCSVSSADVTVKYNVIPENPLSGGNQSVCATSPLQTLTATATVSSGTIVWYDALADGNEVNPIWNSVGSVTYYAQNNIGSCSSISRTPVNLEIKDSPFLNVIAKTCSADLLSYTVELTATSGSVISISPSVGVITGNLITDIPKLTNIVITADKGNGCVEPFDVPAPNCSCAIINNPVSGGDKSICEGQINSILSASVNAGETIDWYADISGGVPLATNSLSYTPPATVKLPGVYTYYAGARKIVDGCISSSRAPVSLTINSQSKPGGLDIQTFCESSNATVADLKAIGTGIIWYADAIGGSPLPSIAPLVDGEDYYASQIGLLCESVDRLKVSVVIVSPSIPQIDPLNLPFFCESKNAKLSDVVLKGIINNSNVIWYDAPVNGLILTPDTAIVSGGIYYAVQQSTTPKFGCESISRLPVSPVIDKQQAPLIDNIVQPTCAVNSASVLFSGLPTTGNWTITPATGIPVTGSGSSYVFKNLIASTDYTFKVTNANSCTSVNSTAVVKIDMVPSVPLSPSESSAVQPTCAVQSGTIVIAPQTGVEYSLNGTTYQLSNAFNGLVPNDYTLYVRNTVDKTCSNASVSPSKINAIPIAPVMPTTLSIIQPTCAVTTGSISIAPQAGKEYSLDGISYQLSNVFNGLAPNDYTLYVRNTSDSTCSNESVSPSKVNAIPIAPVTPAALSIVQPTCAVPTGSILITPEIGIEYSLDGTTYQLSNAFSGLIPNDYMLYIRSAADKTCSSASVNPSKINAIPALPLTPTTLSVVQPTCAVTSGSVSIVPQTGREYSLDGITYQLSNVFNGLAPNDYLLYVRNVSDVSCATVSLSPSKINAVPAVPEEPTILSIVQPTCAIPSGTVTIAAPQTGVEYSLDGILFQDNPQFLNLAPRSYQVSVRLKNDITCKTVGVGRLVAAIPPEIQFESTWTCQSNKYELTASPLSNSYDPNAVEYIWKDQNGNNVGTNSNVLNVTDVIDATTETETFPLVYTLTVKSNSTGCETTSNVVIESIYCDIQKGISPDGNGSNDYFDLRLMDVKKLEIFNRYGIKVYSQSNYTDQWSGQTNSGEALPSATYYYVINFNNGKSKTGWIYLIREN